MADKQIQEVIAAMMSISVFEERPRKSTRKFSGWSQHQSGMGGSFISESTNMPRQSCNALRDSQDLDSDEEEGQ